MLKFSKNILKSLKDTHEIHIGMKDIIKDRLIKMIMTNWKKEDTCLEILGIMANSKLGKEWTDILLAHDEFINNIEKKMVDGITPDDILMAIVGLIANICQEAECASYIERRFLFIQNFSSRYCRCFWARNTILSLLLSCFIQFTHLFSTEWAWKGF